jgi:hypothetical protein
MRFAMMVRLMKEDKSSLRLENDNDENWAVSMNRPVFSKATPIYRLCSSLCMFRGSQVSPWPSLPQRNHSATSRRPHVFGWHGPLSSRAVALHLGMPRRRREKP